MKKLKVNAIIHTQYQNLKKELTEIIEAYDEIDTYIAKGTRNSIKLESYLLVRRLLLNPLRNLILSIDMYTEIYVSLKV
ncbi:Uncharacterised protein [Myroides odoratimimus]|uniref:hypothetical protein n=1 Tax=Myroides odoratimimus TaxID=76832 RepID=UPI000A5E93B0|nr:hypothetical protein [Myroides odoratimimus]STZ46931.1 Uncharacterised protein [Myroides odoratimimus]